MIGACIERGALHQVLLNLLDNAIKYGPNGQTIRMSATTEGPTTRLAVDDEGPGVPRDEREQVWREFVRGRNVVDNPLAVTQVPSRARSLRSVGHLFGGPPAGTQGT